MLWPMTHHRRKTRTHVKVTAPANGPRSFVIKHGQVGHSLTQLVRDVRKVMEPNTASRLRVSLYVSLTAIACIDMLLCEGTR